MPENDGVSTFVVIGLVALLLLRLVRWARLSAPAELETRCHPAPPRRPLWGPTRKLDKLTQTNAIVRAEAELFQSEVDKIQARHNLDRLITELTPPATLPGAPAQLAGATAASLTLPEIRAVLASIDMPADLRAALLQLLQATANEKIGQ